VQRVSPPILPILPKKKKGTHLSLSLSLSRNAARLSSNFADTFLPKQRDNVKTEGNHPLFKHAIWSMSFKSTQLGNLNNKSM
jgi:hypothetical protein